MSVDSSKVRVPSRWAKALEYGLFGFPAMLGIACLLAFYMFGNSLSGPRGLVGMMAIAWLLSLVGGFVLSTIIAVSLYRDAQRIGEADLQWNPSPILYGVGGFFVSGAVALHYLYKRYEYTATDAPSWDGWWYGVTACFVAAVLVVVASQAAVPMSVWTLGAVFVGTGVLPIVVYKDAVHVRASESDWFPNPVNYFLAASVTGPLVVLPALVSGYYLYKRHKHVGTP